MAVLLQYRAGEGFAAHHENCFVVLLQLVHKRNEVAVAADDRKRIDVIVRERHFQRVEGEVKVTPFLSPRGEGSRCTIWTAYSESCRVEFSSRPEFA